MQGKQYTKRILPEFLRPFCRIRLDLSMGFYTVNYTKSGKYNWEAACAYLGCIDIRTAKRHITDIQVAVPIMILELTQVLSHKSGFVTDTSSSPDMPPASLLTLRVNQVREYHTLLYGNLPVVIPEFYTIGYAAHLWFCGRNFSTSYVSRTVKWHDTS